MEKDMPEETKYNSIDEYGFGEEPENHDWNDGSLDELSPMVRKAIRRGEQALAEAAQANGAAYKM
ncbi:small, acid-soluble spore protein, alpha/beta type|uniref:Uncharacterized protein n=1 Tax=Dendrosporobacter quercicolus TaxID=146817 RepID=A0A1G9YB40_9FIRM|nr:hypothetical protein [Dendrosporobacter quercicolus]NSL47592.1 small, acid-soluble spore protein, alpha/beta type [Dendrosporobacter quercicolus DSM 1736]SDN06230.1 hypothetical protein SAMN04488502_11141 [Dendrosporobacter quercicolus]